MSVILENNATGVAVVTRPAGVRRDQFNYIEEYDYLQKYAPHAIPGYHEAYGSGLLTELIDLLEMTGTYASDQVKHAEKGRLMNRVTGATVAGNTFTCPVPHNAQPNMIVNISDGVREFQAYVDSVTNNTVFVALSTEAAGFDFTGSTVDIQIDFSNTWDKATGTFATGNVWDPKFYENQTQILKWRADEAESDMAHDTWLMLPDGEIRWTNVLVEQSNNLFRNIVAMTQFFGRQVEDGSDAATAGAPKGMKSVRQQVEERGNVVNGYFETIEDLQDMALIINEQGVKATNYCILCDLEQMNLLNAICASASPSSVNQYGTFPNGENMAIKLDFTSIKVSGITFWFKHLKALNDVTAFGGGRFRTTGMNFIAFPLDTTTIKESVDGTEKVKTSKYLNVLYRVKNGINRRLKMDIFGHGGTPQLEDKMTISYLSETTVQLVGANAWFVGAKGDAYYTYDA